MAIHTRMGSEVKILKPADVDGFVDCERIEDGSQRDFHVSELDEEYSQIMADEPSH